MYNIEKYAEGSLNSLSLLLFERKMRKDKNFRKQVVLYQNIDFVMKGAALAKAAEFEMREKQIDLVTKGFVYEYKQKKEKFANIKEFLSWS